MVQTREPLVPHQPAAGQVALRWLGQGGFAFRSPGGVVWCVDPYLSNYGRRAPVERLAPTPVQASELEADAVLCTHAHSDHVDPLTLTAIAQASPRCRFYAAAEGIGQMQEMGIAPERLHTVKAGDRGVSICSIDGGASDVSVDVVYASHSGDAVGYLFTVGAGPQNGADGAAGGRLGGDAGRPLRVYVTGDSLYEPELISDTTRGVDVLCVCINGRLGNMNFEEAARLAGELGARTVVPMHFGVMPHNTIDPQLFLDSLVAQSIAAQPRLLAIGESVVL